MAQPTDETSGGPRWVASLQRFWLGGIRPLHGLERGALYLSLFVVALVSPSSPLRSLARHRVLASQWYAAPGLLGAIGISRPDPDGIALAVAVLIVSWLAAALGLFTRPAMVMTAALAAALHGVTLPANSQGAAWYLPMAALVALAFTRSTDRWALDHLWRGRPVDPPRADLSSSGLGRRLLLIVVVAVELAAGCSKLREAGLGWADGETLGHWLHGQPGAVAKAVQDLPTLLAGISVVTLAVELAAPLALLSRRLRIVLLSAWLATHGFVALTIDLAHLGHLAVLLLLLGTRERPDGVARGEIAPREPRHGLGPTVAASGATALLAVMIGTAVVGGAGWPGPPGDVRAAYVGRGIHAGFWDEEYRRVDRVRDVARRCHREGCSPAARMRLAERFRLRLVGRRFRPLDLHRGVGVPDVETFRRLALGPAMVRDLAARRDLVNRPDEDTASKAFLRRARAVARRQVARPERYLRLELVYDHDGGDQVVASVPMRGPERSVTGAARGDAGDLP